MSDERPHRPIWSTVSTILVAAVILAAWALRCEQRPVRTPPPSNGGRAPAATHPATSPATSTAPATQPATKPAATEPATRKRDPVRISVKWATIKDSEDSKQDTIIDGSWTGGDRIEIKTTNTKKMVLDFNQLPPAARRAHRGAWNLQIDGFPIEYWGRRGNRIELTHKENGGWEITGPPPAPRD